MRIFANTGQRIGPDEIAKHAQRAEAMGYDGLNIPEAVHDGLLLATVALSATNTLRVNTSVLVAFTRSPMTTAVAAWDLQKLSDGRFELGLGAQVRGNVERRYGAAWSPPVERMREYVGALRAIFACWQNGEKLAFKGKHYRIDRMQPFFAPEPLSVAPPPISLGAVAPRMTRLVGELGTSLITHPTNSHPRYLREVLAPRLAEGAQQAEREVSSLLHVGPICATGRDGSAVRAAREEKRKSLAFLFSTPAYWKTLELFGWEDRGRTLHELSRANRWAEMTEVIDDEVLDTLVPQGPYSELSEVLRRAYAELADTLVFPMPADPADDPEAARSIAALRS